jgi:hypothetical protein
MCRTLQLSGDREVFHLTAGVRLLTKDKRSSIMMRNIVTGLVAVAIALERDEISSVHIPRL